MSGILIYENPATFKDLYCNGYETINLGCLSPERQSPKTMHFAKEGTCRLRVDDRHRLECSSPKVGCVDGS